MSLPCTDAPSARLERAPGEAEPVRLHWFRPEVAEQWDSFVRMQDRGTFFHLTGWKRAVERTFEYEPCYFYAESRGQITGVAPFFCVSNWLRGRSIISVPLAVYGGVCAANPQSASALLDRAKALVTERQLEFIELRERSGGILPGFHANPRFVTFVAELSPDPETDWKRLPRDTRYMIRKAEKAGLRATFGLEQMDVFYRLFAVSMRRHGTPVLPRSWFENLLRELEDQLNLLVIYQGSRPLAGVLSFVFGSMILPYYAGAVAEARRVAANNFMYWELMKSAAQRGLRRFDFGRSKKGTGAYAFKTQWHTKSATLDYQFFLANRKNVPNFSPTNPKFELATRIWQRLPLWMTMLVGPRVIRWFP